MKKVVIFLIAMLPVITGSAQSSKLVSANNYYKDYLKENDPASLNKAKEAIDLALAHPDTKDLTKTQVYAGQIYLAIFDLNLRTQTEKQTSVSDPNKKALIAYQNTPSSDLETAFRAYSSGRKLDVKGNYKSDIESGYERVGGHYGNKAKADYNAKKYVEALPAFEIIYEINGVNDTVSLGNCALVAERAGAYDKAKVYLQKMIELKQGRGNTYSSLVTVNLLAKDTATAMDVLKKGRAAFPNDIGLLISETNYFLKTNKSQEALLDLNLAIAAKSNDQSLYLVRGNIYDNLSNPKDEAGKEMAKPKDYADMIKLAEADYKKAIELKPDYFDALFNLGVLYNNSGVALNKLADEITDNAKNAAANAKATEAFKQALPLLEKALEVNPNDRNTMFALKQIYSRMQMADKLKAINEKLKN